MTELLSKEALQKKDDLPTRTVEVPEWGGSVRLRGLSGKKRMQMRRCYDAKTGEIADDEVLAKVLVWSMVGADGKPVLTESDVPWLIEKNGVVLVRLAEAVMEMSAMTEKSAAEVKENLPAARSDASASN
jgi:hypothetical protein